MDARSRISISDQTPRYDREYLDKKFGRLVTKATARQHALSFSRLSRIGVTRTLVTDAVT